MDLTSLCASRGSHSGSDAPDSREIGEDGPAEDCCNAVERVADGSEAAAECEDLMADSADDLDNEEDAEDTRSAASVLKHTSSCQPSPLESYYKGFSRDAHLAGKPVESEGSCVEDAIQPCGPKNIGNKFDVLAYLVRQPTCSKDVSQSTAMSVGGVSGKHPRETVIAQKGSWASSIAESLGEISKSLADDQAKLSIRVDNDDEGCVATDIAEESLESAVVVIGTRRQAGESSGVGSRRQTETDNSEDSEVGEDLDCEEEVPFGEEGKEGWAEERCEDVEADCGCDGRLCERHSCTRVADLEHLGIGRELDETPPFDVETGEQSPYSSCGSPPPPSSQAPTRKRKLSESEMSDEDDCSSKKLHPDSERDKTEGRVWKLLHKERPPAHIQTWLNDFGSWPKAEQNLAIERLLATRCDSHQLRHVRTLIEPHFQRDFISLLPKELALYVLSFLEPRDLVRAAQTCSTWRFLAEDNLLWREKCREASIKELPRRPKCATWKAAFMRQHRIEWNWRTPRSKSARPTQYLRGHDDHVITCLQFTNNRIVSGSDDNTLKVWNATTGKCLRTLIGHTGGVWSSQMNDTIIISGSTDRTLRVWEAETGKCVHVLQGHSSTVRCMHLHGNKVVSGSRDATLRVWDVESGECLYVLVGHLAAVRCVQYDGKLVVSGAYDYMVKVWNPEREECLHTLQGHTNRVYSLQFDGIHVVSGSLDTSIRVWDVETGALKHTLMGHQSLTSGMELRDNILVSGNADSTVKVWDIITGQCLQTLSGPNKHQSAVTCLQFNRRFVITSSDDGTVKLWDVRTGDFIRNLVSLYSGGSGGVVWRIRANDTKLVCAVGSRNGTEETKLVVLDFEVDRPS